jgi:hypothetical protein
LTQAVSKNIKLSIFYDPHTNRGVSRPSPLVAVGLGLGLTLKS